MVHVEVIEVKYEAGTFFFELAPATDAGEDGIPAFVGLVGNGGEPEIAVVEELIAVSFVEDGGVLAGVFAIVATYAYAGVSGKEFVQILQHAYETFLGAEDVKVVKANKVGNDGGALLPAIAGLGVVGIIIAQVVGAYSHAAVLGAGGSGER